MKQDRPEFFGPDREAAAVIGLSCLFPGAEDLSAYWQVIKNGLDAIGDIPPDHWSVSDYYDPDPKAEDRTYGRRGGFLAPIDFEPLKYGIVPKDISAIDSTQLLGLVAADRALKDAGYEADGTFDHQRTAVLMGVTGALKMVVSLGSRLAHPQLRRALKDSGLDDGTAAEVLTRFAAEFTPWQENSFPGLLGNVTAGRIANRLNLGGANMVVDAACGSSLAAVRQGLMELASGQADLVVTGGVDTFSDPFMYTCFSKTPALSPTGEVRAYDQAGDGTMLGEGVGVLVLKRLAEARRDGDRIYAVIRSIGSSSDGKGAAIFAPTPQGQMRALKNAYESAGVEPGSIELIEGHGTGTSVGDAVEVEALSRVFAEAPPQTPWGPWCALGSVKSQIGHAKAAAGSAGLIKSILAICHKTLPPAVKVERPLELLTRADSPLYISSEARPWVSAGPRRAGVSAFGFGGSNFHCVVEEAGENLKEASAPNDLILLALSGESKEMLAARLAAVALAENLMAAARASRPTFSGRDACRLVITCRERDFARLTEETLEQLRQTATRPEALPEGVYFDDQPANPGALGFLLPGPDSVRPNMFRELALDWPEMVDALSRSAAELALEAPELPPLGLVLYPPDLAGPQARQSWHEALADARLRLAASSAVARGLSRILEKFGLKPTVTLGGGAEPVNFVQELNRKTAQSIGLWLEVGAGCELSLAALGALGNSRQVLAFDQGEGGQADLAAFLARLAVRGVSLDLSAWPDHQGPAAETEEDEAGFTIEVSGANQFEKKIIPPSPPKSASAPAAGKEGGDLAEALKTVTAETARLHQAFLDHQAEAMDLIRRSLGAEPPRAAEPARPAAGVVMAAESRPSASPAAQAGGPDVAEVMRVVSQETGYPVEMLNPAMDLEADLGLDSIKKVEIMAVLGERFPEVQGLGAETMNKAATLGDLIVLVGPAGSGAGFAPAPAPAAAAPITAAAGAQALAADGGEIWPLLRDVVASETGYPVEMLRPELSLTDDLGLDSIKLVEIASLMSEKSPSAANAGAEAVSGARTLAELAQALGGGSNDSRLSSSAPTAPRAKSSEKSFDAASVVLEVVSRETGYPLDMLNPAMNLEADLGLDSIKKVEIMAALSERLPQAEALSTGEVMAGLETLGDLAALVSGPAAEANRVSPAPAAVSYEPPAAPAPSSSGVDLGEALLDVVSAETGYPREMLSFKASLEADLGLDSIKKVEIMAALSEKMGDDSLAASSAEVLSGAVTLGDLRDLLSPAGSGARTAGRPAREVKKRGPGRPPKNSPPAFILKEDESEDAAPARTSKVSSFKVEMTPTPLTPSPAAESFFGRGGPVLLAANPSPLAEILEEKFRSAGRGVKVMPWLRLNQLDNADAFENVIFIWPGGDNNLDLALAAFGVLKTQAPAVLRAAEAGRAPLVAGLTFMGGAFALGGGQPQAPASAALTGLLKTLAREWRGARVKAIDLPLEAFDRSARDYIPALASVWGEAEGGVELGLADPRTLLTPGLKSYKLKNIRVRHIREGQTVVVTGGARGVTAAALKELAGTFRPHLVIMGRTPLASAEPAWLEELKNEAAIRQALFDRARVKPSPRDLARESARILANREIKGNLAAMEKAGAKVTYISGDFQNPEVTIENIGEIKRLYGPVHGFIHGAGVLADALITDKKDEDFVKVFDTKAKMACLILSELADQPLNLAAFFSSSTARFGRRGQADYAAGNEVLNKLAAALAAGRQGPKCLSVNWGPWAGGMVDASLARLFEEEGVGLIPIDEGARLFAALAGSPKNDPVEVVVLGPGTDISALG